MQLRCKRSQVATPISLGKGREVGLNRDLSGSGGSCGPRERGTCSSPFSKIAARPCFRGTCKCCPIHEAPLRSTHNRAVPNGPASSRRVSPCLFLQNQEAT